jgi:hypothetical protein
LTSNQAKIQSRYTKASAIGIQRLWITRTLEADMERPSDLSRRHRSKTRLAWGGLKRLLAIPLVLASIASPALVAPAVAVSPADEIQPVELAFSNPDIFVASEPPRSEAGATFYPLPEKARGSLIILPEVAADLGLPSGPLDASERQRVLAGISNLPVAASGTNEAQATRNGISTQPTAAQSYFWSPFSFFPGGSYSGAYRRNASFIGSSGFDYQWQVAAGSNSQACTLGAGYYQGYNGGSFGLWKDWYGLGCGRGGGAHVPWDNVAAYPELMAKSMYGLTGGSGLFT